MREIRPITAAELDDFVTLSANAYPGINLFSASSRERFRTRMEQMAEEPAVQLVGLFAYGQMLGAMRLFDFTMKLLSTKTLVGGVGGVAVDLLHKKEKVAYDMVQYFLHHYRDRGACLTALYPFRPDFYKRMGFGYGTKMNHYRVRPQSLPRGAGRAHVSFLTEADREALAACYGRYLEQTNGLMERFSFSWETIFEEPSIHVVGVKENGRISGYLTYQFEQGSRNNFLSNNMLVRELVYETPQALAELLTFLHTQLDQIEHVIINTQDDAFHYLLGDPRNDTGDMLHRVLYHESNTQGVGIMYRVIDVARLFEVLRDHDFNGQSCRLQIVLDDSFLPQNAGRTTVWFENGRARLVGDGAGHEAAIRLDVAEFSSLVTGAVGFRRLYGYGLAAVSEAAYVGVVDRIFAAPQPLCLTSF